MREKNRACTFTKRKKKNASTQSIRPHRTVGFQGLSELTNKERNFLKYTECIQKQQVKNEDYCNIFFLFAK